MDTNPNLIDQEEQARNQENEARGAQHGTVSVVIPCYNHARFLGKAIASVLTQTYPATQVIVIDDGSTDTTAAVAKRFNAVVYCHQDNLGLSAARNSGLALVNEEFVVFLDADDVLYPTALESAIRCFHESPTCAFVSGGYRRMSETGDLIQQLPSRSANANDYENLLRGNCIGMHAAVMYRANVVRECGGFDVNQLCCEDYDLYLRISKTWSIGSHSDVVAKYRTYSGSMSGDNMQMLRASLDVLRRQRTPAQFADSYNRARREGERAWIDLYGHRVVQEAIHQMCRGQVRLGVRDLCEYLAIVRGRNVVKSSAIVFYIAEYNVRNIVRKFLRKLMRPPVGQVDFGDLRALRPIGRAFGYERGEPIDRYYIEQFLDLHRGDISGYVLEIGDATYTNKFSGSCLRSAETMHISDTTATYVGDLTSSSSLPAERFDCAIITQTLHLIFDVSAALTVLERAIKPGGVLLLTVPGVTQVSQDEWAQTWFWSFTELSLHRLLSEAFKDGEISVQTHGNVVAATGFLHGLSASELTKHELNQADPRYQFLVTARVQKTV